ncbi:MAG: VCBS repeat-containing protein, partial [Planctomycetota bacterium]
RLHVRSADGAVETVAIDGAGKGFLAASDLNGDGLADLVLHDEAIDQVRVLFAASEGQRFKPGSASDLLVPASQQPTTSGGPRASATLADFDRDGDPDLLATAGEEFFLLRGTASDHDSLRPGLNDDSRAEAVAPAGTVDISLVLDEPTAELPPEVSFERLVWRAYYRATAEGEPVRSQLPVASGDVPGIEFPHTLNLNLSYPFAPIWYIEIDTWATIDGWPFPVQLPTRTVLVAPEHLDALEAEGLPGGTLWDLDLRSDHFGFTGDGTSGSAGVGHIPRLPPPIF